MKRKSNLPWEQQVKIKKLELERRVLTAKNGVIWTNTSSSYLIAKARKRQSLYIWTLTQIKILMIFWWLLTKTVKSRNITLSQVKAWPSMKMIPQLSSYLSVNGSLNATHTTILKNSHSLRNSKDGSSWECGKKRSSIKIGWRLRTLLKKSFSCFKIISVSTWWNTDPICLRWSN